MVLVKNLKFLLTLPFMQNTREKVFGDVLVRKQAFLHNRNMDFKKRKNGIFPKGRVHDFCQEVDGF